jgi:hypothetical protein
MADETPKPEEAAKKPEPPKWEYKTDFAITDKMRDVIKQTIKVSEMESEMLRKKLDRLTYGG